MTDTGHDVTETLLSIAAHRPDAPFLRQDGRDAMRWSALARRIGELRASFAQWDIVRGDLVVAAAGDRARDFALIAAAPAASSFLLLAPSLAEEAYAEMLERTRARAVVVPGDAAHPLARAAARCGAMLLRVIDDAPGEAGAFRLEAASTAARRHPPRTSAGVALVTATSGTTGRPKLVPLTHRSLMAQAMHMGARLAMSPADVAWHGVPLHLAFGKRSGFLLCALNGGATHCLPESDVGALQALLEGDPPGYLPMTFAVARELLARIGSRPARSGRRLRFAIVASGAFDPAERERLESALGAPVLRHYGTTEAGTVSIQAPPPAPRSADGSGEPVDAIVTLVDTDGAEVPAGETGEILVRGPQVFEGYLDDADASAAALVGGAYRTGDLARLGDDGELRIVDRIKDVINRGGEQIAPAAIDEALRAVPGVADGAAFGIAHPTLGEEVGAAVVLAPGTIADAEPILARLRETLGARRAPRRLWFVDALPRNRAGKVTRGALPAWVGAAVDRAPAAQPAASAPHSPLEIALAGLWAAVLRSGPVPRDANFFMLGGDSLRGASLVEQVRAAFGVELPVECLFEDAGTIAGMARRVERAMRERTD